MPSFFHNGNIVWKINRKCTLVEWSKFSSLLSPKFGITKCSMELGKCAYLVFLYRLGLIRLGILWSFLVMVKSNKILGFFSYVESTK